MRHRYQHPKLGRWSTRDPLGYIAGDRNLYNFVGGGPASYADSTGLGTGFQGPWGPGMLCVDSKCDPKKCPQKMLPEGPWDKGFEALPAPGKCKQADAVGSPGAVTVKIPNGWTCILECDKNGAPTGKLHCFPSGFPPPPMKRFEPGPRADFPQLGRL